MLHATRMVSASTVTQTLNKHAFFASDQHGNWRFDPAALLQAKRPDVIARWQKATRSLLASDDDLLREAQASIRTPINELRERLLRLEATHSVTHAADLPELVEQLNDDPYNDLLASDLLRTIQQRIATDDSDLSNDPTLCAIFQALNPQSWSVVVRPALREQVNRLQGQHAYERALALARSWTYYDGEHGCDIGVIAANAEAWQLVNVAQPTLDAALAAVKLAPGLSKVREKLHTAAQSALQQHTSNHWRSIGDDAAAVATFFDHVQTASAVRPHLDHTSQQAFDCTVQQEAHKLWAILHPEGQLHLALCLAAHVPGAKLDRRQMEVVLNATKQTNAVQSLLIGLALWRICPNESYSKQQVAQHIARNLAALRMWEVINITKIAGPWKPSIQPETLANLRGECLRYRATHVQREQAFLETLRQEDDSPLSRLLGDEQQALMRIIEHDLEQMMVSAG